MTNPVGYQYVTIEPGFHLFCATFDEVDGTNYRLENVVVCTNGVPVDMGNTAVVAIQKMTLDGDGGYDSERTYTWKHRSSKSLGWYIKTSATEATGITLESGEGISIENKLDQNIELRFSGAVSISPVSCVISDGFSLIGNMTPVPLDIQDIKVCDLDGKPIDKGSTTVVTIQKMTTDGEGYYDSEGTYTWKHRTGKDLGWYVKTSATVATGVSLLPGEAVSINNANGGAIKLVYKSPLANKVD